MIFPKTSKIEKVVSKDTTHPVLLHPFLRIGEDGGEILASNLHTALVIPVDVRDEDTSGPIHLEALKAARKNGAELRCEPGYCIADGEVAYPRDDVKYAVFPPIEQLLVSEDQAEVEIALNAKTLYELAQAMGTEIVKLRIQQDVQTMPIGVEPHPSQPHVSGARAAMMPFKLSNSL